MTKLTLFEIHLEDASFTANAPNSGIEPADDETEAAVVADGGTNPLPILLALATVVVLAVIGRRLLGGESEPVPL